MPRQAALPPNLLHGPFTLDQAARAGLTRWQLEGAHWRRLGPRTYIWAGVRDDPMFKLQAVRHRLPRGAAFSGLTAAWLHGLDITPDKPIEVTVPATANVSTRAGMAVRRCALEKRDVVDVRGMPATAIARTIGEICSRLPLVEAVVIADSALHSGRVGLDQLTSWAESNPRGRGLKNLRRVLSYAEPAAESPMESRLRMLLVLNGLARPRAQVSIHDRWGRFVGRPDLYYDAPRLGIEYDGAGHREALAEDNRRQNKLLNAGVRLLRFTAGDLVGNPESVVRQVREMLAPDPRHG